jgi:hypothetical protein
MVLHLVPVLLNGGEPVFKDVADLHGLELVHAVSAPGVTHLKFARTT